ncbi:hypothetical protein ACFWWA_34940 [Streptomyces goshikiensis]|uniref:Imm32 family immunity protein n=1 Tax=Streptomyces goshikiensis TaxID=1942 RepID=UPI0036587DE8
MASESSSAPVESNQVTTVTAGVAQVFRWEADARIEVRDLGREVVIEANAAGLRTLAGHLLVLAGDGVPDGSHLRLEDSTVWRMGPSAWFWSAATTSEGAPAAVWKLGGELTSTADINDGA